MAKLNSPHFVSNFDKTVIVKDANGDDTLDYSQLKDREILVKDENAKELVTVKKHDIPDEESNYQMINQIENTVYKLVAKGEITTINVHSISTQYNGEDPTAVTIGRNKYVPFSVDTDIATGEPIMDSGDWSDGRIMNYFGIRPCVLDSNGNVTKYLNPNDYNYYGYTPGSYPYNDNDCTSPRTGENIMIEFRKMYTRKEIVDGILYIYLSPDMSIDYDNWQVHPAFISEKVGGKDIYGNPVYADKIYISAFPTSIITNPTTGLKELCSRAMTTVGATYKESLQYAKNIGRGFEVLTYSKLSLLFEIYMLMSACKSFYLNRYIHSNNNTIDDMSESLNKGLLSIFKAKTSIGDYEYHTKFLGITDLFNMPMLVAGYNVRQDPISGDANTLQICMALHGPYIDDAASIKTDLPENYTALDITTKKIHNGTTVLKLDSMYPALGNVIFVAEKGLWSSDMPYSTTERYLQLVQYWQQVPSSYMIFGAGQNSNHAVQYRDDSNGNVYKTLLTYS